MKKALLCLLMAGCFDYEIPQPKPKAPTVDGVQDVQGDPTPEVSCPTLVYGVVKCSDLAPECSTPAPSTQESGLHCIPGYEDDLSVPCFCVGSTTADSWCIRQEGP